MQMVFSTSSVHARDRLDYWREEATKAYVLHEFETPLGRTFNGIIRAGEIGDLSLANFESDECLVQRTHRCLSSATDDDLLVGRQICGSMVLHQDGHDAETGMGDMFLMDPRRPFALDIRPNTSTLVIKAPRSELQARLGDVSGLTARPLRSANGIAGLASDFLAMLPARTCAIEDPLGSKVAQQTLDLVALAFKAETRNGTAVLSTPRTTTLLRLKAIIESRLRDPALKPAVAAAAAGISVRYANALLAQEGTSLERFIMLRRLQHCYQALTDPAHAFRTVSDIAYSCGFSDVSHFTRRFKAQYGCPPSECRPRAGELPCYGPAHS